MKARTSFLVAATLALTLTYVSNARAQMYYYGGDVLLNPTIVMLYVDNVWFNYWSSPDGQSAQTVVEDWMTTIGATRWGNTLTQYYDRNGAHPRFQEFQIAGRYSYMSTKNPFNANDVNAYVNTWLGNYPAPTIVFQVSAPGLRTSCSNNGIDSCNGSFGVGKGTMIVNTGTSFPTFDPANYSSGWFHELAEVITDSRGNGWEEVSTGSQIGDVCDYNDSPWYSQSPNTDLIRSGWLGTTYSMNSIVGLTMSGGVGGAPICIHGVTNVLDTTYKDPSTSTTIDFNPLNLGYVNFGPRTAWATSTAGGDPGQGSTPHGNWGSWFVDGNRNVTQVYPNPDIQYYAESTARGNWGPAPSGWTFTGSVDVAVMGEGRVDAVVLGSRSGYAPQLFHRGWDRTVGGFVGPWQSLGDLTNQANVSSIASGPAAISRFANEIYVFVTALMTNDTHPHMYYWACYSMSQCNSTSWSIGGFGAPANGVVLAGDPDVASWGDGRLDIFTRTSTGTLYHLFYTGPPTLSWYSDIWTPPSGVTFVGNPTVASAGERRFLVGVQDSTGHVQTSFYNNAWAPWQQNATIGAGMDFSSH